MSRAAILLSAVLLAQPFWAHAASAVEANIMTGSPSGTYIQFGRDLARLMEGTDTDLVVNSSAGSVENLYAVFRRPQTQFGIVQSDVLDFVRSFRETDQDLAQIVERSRIVAPLYNEEIHLIVRPEVESLSDLSDYVIGIGLDESGTQLTASIVLQSLGLEPGLNRSSPTDSLELFLAGEIDGFFFVSGAPIGLLQDERLTAENAKLLPMTEPALATYYNSATIPANTYPWQAEAVEGVAVKAVLMTYDFGALSGAYFEQSCDIVRNVSAALFGNIQTLQETGHPKWNQVDLTDIPPGWETGSCVVTDPRAARALSAPRDCEAIGNPIARQICESSAE